ncbi:MAG: redox-regulated ATPase YchF [Opitutales bacterium]|nr:redox-regulated ATPase YchF [Opitutales bacterium]
MQAGIIGLPNVGKSTLFNALTRSRKAEAANYPFCTIEPNVGVVIVPDERLPWLQTLSKSEKIIPAAIEFVDIAGLVAGASKGEGLGNKFLSNIREVDAVVHVVRCFDDDDIIHNMGKVDPVRDIQVIETELILADIQSCEKQLDNNLRKAKGQDKDAVANAELLNRLIPFLNEGKPANIFPIHGEDEKARLNRFYLLSDKPVIYACNVAEGDLADIGSNKYVAAVRDYVSEHRNSGMAVICSKLEEELGEMSPDEAREFLKEMGVDGSGVSSLINATYDLLGLASYLTEGPKEVRAWTFHKGMKAPQCAAIIHTDFEKGFIKAEVVAFKDLVAAGSVVKAREAGKYRIEGKDYVMQDGDVVVFRVNA